MEEPTRQGRAKVGADWRTQYQDLLMTAEEAAALVRNRDVLALSGGGNWPFSFDAALAARLKQQRESVEVNALFLLRPAALLGKELKDQVIFNSNFFAREREWAGQGNIHFTPTHLGQTGEWLAAREPQVVVLTCSPPDENGWMSRSLWGAQIHRCVFEAPSCRTLIAVVNRNLPYCESDGENHTLLHVSEVDAIVEDHYEVPELTPAPVSETDKVIAGYIADLVPDGACVQFGLGGLANAVGADLSYAGKHDLGLQTEVLSNCVIDLMKKGIINNSRKQTYPGRSVVCQIVGDKTLWDFAERNPDFCLKEICWVNNPRRIAQNDNVVSINNALEIDLTGQVVSEAVGTRQYSGTGGQLEWVVGSQWSKGGKSIIALKSSYRDKSGVLHSKIRPSLPAGSIITTPRTCVQYVVTEYGVANLKYKSVTERARALIAIAHPDFREELKKHLSL